MELVEQASVFVLTTLGFVLFFFLERFIYWYHGYGHETDISQEIADPAAAKEFAYLNLVGDGIHNFIDGMIIAASYLVGFSEGFATTIAVIFQELPQELGDHGILVYAGFKRSKALLLNFAVALNVVLGGIIAIMFVENLEALNGMLITLSPDGFIYLAASELVPELHKDKDSKKSAVQFVIFTLGIVLTWSFGAIFPE